MHSASSSSFGNSNSGSNSDSASIENTAVVLLCGSCLQTRHEVAATSAATSSLQHDEVRELSYWPLSAVLAREVRNIKTLTQ
jgi:hypothetical protein